MNEDVIRLSDVRAIPDMTIAEQDVYGPNGHPGDTRAWQPLNLADPEYAIPPDPPSILGLLYTGRRHVISGPPESVKTLLAYIVALTALRDGVRVAIIDFEMGPVAARRLLTDLGATTDELQALYYVNPETGPEHGLHGIIQHGAQLAIVDAAIGAYDVSGLDDNARKDAQAFSRTWIDPLWKNQIATLLIDHVTKNVDTRGKFTIGSERKLGSSDVHLGLEVVKTLSRGTSGIVKIHVHKDRPGFLPRPHAAILDLASDPDTHRVEWHLKPADPTDPDTGEFRPTALMEKVSRYLETVPEPVARAQVEDHVKGKRDYLRAALDILTREGYVEESRGARGARLVHSLEPYRKPENDLAPTSPPPRPGEDMTTSPHLAPSLQGGEVTGRGQSGEEPSSTSPRPIDVTDPAVQKLLDDDIPW